MPDSGTNKCMTALLVCVGITITVASVILISIFLFWFPRIKEPDLMTMTSEKSSRPAVTPPPKFTAKGMKQEIYQVIERIKTRGYEIQDILKDLSLDLEALERGENLTNLPESRKLDPLSLYELRQHLSYIRLDSNPGNLKARVEPRAIQSEIFAIQTELITSTSSDFLLNLGKTDVYKYTKKRKTRPWMIYLSGSKFPTNSHKYISDDENLT